MVLVTRRIAQVVVGLVCLMFAVDAVGAVGAVGGERPQAATVTIHPARGSSTHATNAVALPPGPESAPVAPAAAAVDPGPTDPPPAASVPVEAPDAVPTDRAPPPAPPEPRPEVAVAEPEVPVVPACAAVQGALVAAVLERVNEVRAAHGVGPLAWDGQLSCLAREWADRMAAERSMYHRDLYAVLRSDGWFRWATLGENLVSGGTVMDARTIVDVWLSSPPHTATMLSDRYAWTGIGIATNGDLMYVAQNFGVLR